MNDVCVHLAEIHAHLQVPADGLMDPLAPLGVVGYQVIVGGQDASLLQHIRDAWHPLAVVGVDVLFVIERQAHQSCGSSGSASWSSFLRSSRSASSTWYHSVLLSR